jgi:hypothetical protein
MTRRNRKRSALGNAAKSIAKRSRKRQAKRNGAELAGDKAIGDVTSKLLPGVGAYAATRVAGRIAYNLTKKRSPAMARHAGPLGSMAVAASTWFFADKFKVTKEYSEAMVIGSAIAAAQSVLQMYIPQWAWVMDDYHMEAINGAKTPTNAPEISEKGDGSLSGFFDDVGGTGELSSSKHNETETDLLADVVGADYAGSFASDWVN